MQINVATGALNSRRRQPVPLWRSAGQLLMFVCHSLHVSPGALLSQFCCASIAVASMVHRAIESRMWRKTEFNRVDTFVCFHRRCYELMHEVYLCFGYMQGYGVAYTTASIYACMVLQFHCQNTSLLQGFSPSSLLVSLKNGNGGSRNWKCIGGNDSMGIRAAIVLSSSSVLQCVKTHH